MLKIQLNNSNHRRIEFTEKSSHSPKSLFKISGAVFYFLINTVIVLK